MTGIAPAMRMLKAMQVDHASGGFHRLAVGKVNAQVGVIGVSGVTREPRFLDRRIIVVVMVVDADDGVAAFEQPQCEGGTDEAGGAGDEDFHRSIRDDGVLVD